MVDETLETAAKLLGIPDKNLMELSEDTQNSMKAIILMFGIKDEEAASEAYDELKKIWQKETLRNAMHDIETVIGFDYNYETLCSLDDETQLKLICAYLYDKNNIYQIYEIARKGMIKINLAEVAEFMNISVEELRKLPEEIQENIYGHYSFNYYDIQEGTIDKQAVINELKEFMQL